MYVRHALAALAAGVSLNATAQETALETVTVTGTREVPMVARCERGLITSLPDANASAIGKLGLQVCLNEGTLESLFNAPRDRINRLNQLLVAYQNLTELRELGTPVQDGEGLTRLPNFSATRLPDGNYSFIWDIKSPKAGESITTLTGLISTRPSP